MGTRARRWVNDKGEVCIYLPRHPEATRKGYVLEKRLIMERALGRPLLRSETVRHKDGDRQNNAPANLVVVPSGAAYRARAETMEVHEASDVAQGAERLIRAVGKRIALGDASELELLGDLQQALEKAWAVAITGLRAQGFSDGEIARALGVSQQAVSKRWKRTKEDEARDEREHGRGA